MTLQERLEVAVSNEWHKIKQGKFWCEIMSAPVNISAYKLMMEQIYHYTKHNSINQAVAAYKTDPSQRKLLKFAYKHAQEELGHEGMVIHDLKSIEQYDEGFESRRPLPATQALIAYLYQVSLEKGAIARLGYSYWAETCYDHIDPLLKKFSADLGLTDRNMTFFVAHSEIDSKHSEEVSEALIFCNPTKDDEESILNVAITTLYLTGQILEQVAAEYLELNPTPKGLLAA
jgi:Iron-containing redox enzyme